MSQYEEVSEQDVTPDSSPETQQQTEQSSDSSQPEQLSQEAAPSPAKSEDNVPFHMHPRFQELIAERKQFREQNETLARRLEEVQQQIQKFQQPAQQKDELMERLMGIDPQFAERFGKINEVDQLKQELSEFREWREQSAREQVAHQVDSLKDKFYTENNVPADRRRLYEAQLAYAAQNDPSFAKLSVSDLPKVMKGFHDEISKMFQSVERSTTKQFVEGKKTEAAKPATQSRGVPAKPAKQDAKPMSREEMRAAIIREALDEARSNKDI
jgi:hypothetical protein